MGSLSMSEPRAGASRDAEGSKHSRTRASAPGGVAGASAPPANSAQSAPNSSVDPYRAFFENLFDGVFQSTPDGRILTANPALVQMLGYDSEEELRAVSIPDLYEDPGDRRELLARIAAAGEVRNQELVLRTRDGKRLLALENSRAVRDPGGNILYHEGSLTDITAWREAENLFRTLAESSPIAIFIAQGSTFIFANRTLVELTGYSEEELLAAGPLDLLRDEDRQAALQNALDMLSGRTEDPFEHRLVRKDGESIWTLATVTSITHRGQPAILGNLIDITERKQAQDLFQTLADSSPVAIFIVQDDRFQFVNAQAQRLTGRSEHDLLCLEPLEVVEPEDRELVAAAVAAQVQGSERLPYEHRVVNAETGEVRWVMDAFTSIVYRGRPAILGNSVDITERKLAEEQLARQAFYDSLTNLPNRALFMQRLEHALHASQRRRKPVAVMFLDLDDFKDVNDTFGHPTGDALLALLGERLQACVRPTDTVARIGGDEFTILLDATDWRDDAVAVAERIVAELKRPFEVDGHQAHISASVGLAFSDPDRHSAADLLREADVALYHAKSAGKGRYVIFGEHAQAA
jgi:diguanylate cyclase (GGDEF)-like protein/PAS domain S-box-containing protein